MCTKRRRLQPVKDGFFVMEQANGGGWKRIDYFDRQIDAERQYPGIEIQPAEPLQSSDDKP